MSESQKIFDIDEITKKLSELEALKEKVEKLYSLSEIGDDVRKELDQYKILREQGVEIPHLDKEFSEQLYPKRENHGPHTKPLLESEIQEALDKSKSAKKAARRLGVSYPTFKKYARLYNIHRTPGWPIKKKEPHERGRGPIDPYKGKYPISDVLQGKYPDFPIHRLKDKLIRSGIKKPECEQCGYAQRRLTDGKLPLLVNFEDGNNKNHKLENVKLLCYNCTFTCGKGYISKGPKIFDPDILQDSKKILNQRF
jgi:hypothetical protein